MKWVIVGIAGIVGVAAIGYVLMQKASIDAGQPEFVRRYQESFVESCAASTEAKLISVGKAVTDATKEMVQRVCTCGAEVSAKEFEKKGEVTLAGMMSLQNDPVFMDRIVEIMESCSRQESAG